jgi:hypothetical protein
MSELATATAARCDIDTPIRNNYFYGKLLDVYHFELETRYFNEKRWLLNRLVSGFGVVCGLDVELGPGDTIVVTSGVALDKWGREIIVPRATRPIPFLSDLPSVPPERGEQKQGGGERRYRHFQVLICYHECEDDPVPVHVGDCHGHETCVPGTIRERYRIELRPGCAPEITAECCADEVISGGRIDYGQLARYVTKRCCDRAKDPCIPLANVRVPVDEEQHHCHPEDIDITVRPIVYSNDVLFELLACLSGEQPKPRGGKQ